MVKVLFFGTPHVAVPYLNWLIEHTLVTGVVCRPDEPVGRGYALTAPPTKDLALKKNIPVFQPEGPWTDSLLRSFQEMKADVGIVVAYGRILPRPIFSAPRHGCLNIHFSLLPKYRGAAPIQWALIRGEKTTGVTGFWLEEGLDSGPISFQLPESINPEDDVLSLRSKLIDLGLKGLEKTIQEVERNKIVCEPQSGEPTLAPQLKKEDGRITWERSAADIANLIRGVREWPGAVTMFKTDQSNNKKLKVYSAIAGPASSGGNKKPGAILDADREGILVATGQGTLQLISVQPEGKKEMPAWSFWQGARLKIGDQLG